MAYSTIIKPNTQMNTVLYTGNGTDNHAITGVNFQPDFVWLKSRSDVDDNYLQDAVRGATKQLVSNSTGAETSYTNGVKSFDSDGITLGTASWANESSQTRVIWNWKAGGSPSSNTDGSITSSVSANATNGFSIVTYTGTGANATVGHGLGSVPKMIIIKGYSNTPNWQVYHASYGNTGGGQLNLDSAFSADGMFQNTTPTSSVFSLGTSGNVNGSGQTMVAYCFAEVKGFSKMGSYVGNGNADGTFVYTGFKPAFIMIKKSSASGNNWQIRDNKRQGFNATTGLLKPNKTDAEQNTDNIDLLSNGFKQRNLAGDDNSSGATYIYMAFAENPLVANTSGGIPTTAR